MQNKYCLPIMVSNFDEIIRKIDKNKDNYGYFEIWLDYINDFETDSLLSLIAKYPGRIVLVFRRENLEPIKMPEIQRFKILNDVLGKDCLVDLDITCQEKELEYSNGKDIKVIASYHNYDETPDNEKLADIVSEIKSYKSYILKISTMCNSAADALRLIGIKKDFLENGKKHIVLGMGKDGEITRIFGALWRNALIFIPETINEASAPGQISREEFDKIMERVKK